MSYILRIEHDEHQSIEIDTEPFGTRSKDLGYILITVEDYAGSLDNPWQSANIYLTPTQAAQICSHLVKDENVVKAMASNYKS